MNKAKSPPHLSSTPRSSHPTDIQASITQRIDWTAPWLQHLTSLSYINSDSDSDSDSHGQDVSLQLPICSQLNQWRDRLQQEQGRAALTSGRGQPLTFVAQDALPEGTAYESFIAKTGGVPTRDNLHDLFNGSIWLTFPRAKALLNRYQALYIEQEGVTGQRGRVRDTITVFDENGAILVTAEPSIGDALVSFDWQRCLVQPRKLWDNPRHPSDAAKAAVYIFGHALLEQLVTPRKPLCAHTLILSVPPGFFALSTTERICHVDEQLTQRLDEMLQDDGVTPRSFSPLPVLGVPHYWSDNVDPAFYADEYVFRSGRRRS